MSGEELNRKYHELCGWTIKKSGPAKNDEWKLVQPNGVAFPTFWPRHLAWCRLPALHLDANLAIAEASKKHPLWTVVVLDGEFVFRVGEQSGKGSTLGEAFLAFEIQDLAAQAGQ